MNLIDLKKKPYYRLLLSVLSYVIAIGGSLIIFLLWSDYIGLKDNLYGYDIYGHLYKIEDYKHALKYNLDLHWYNGIVMYAAWPAGVYSLIVDLCGSSIYNFYMLMSVVAVLPFVYLGNRKERHFLGIFCGISYPYLPVILKGQLVEGNLAWYMAVVITAYIVVNMYVLMDSKKEKVVNYIPTIITGVLLYASLFAVHYMLSAITGLFLGLVILAYCNSLYHRRIYLGKKYVRNKIAICFTYLILDGGFAGYMFMTAIRSALGNMGGEQSGYIWNHTLKESLIVTKNCSYYYGMFIFLLSLMSVGICLYVERQNKAQYVQIIKILSFTSPLFLIWCAIPVEKYQSVPLSSMLWPERFSALVISSVLVSIIAFGDLRTESTTETEIWIAYRIIVWFVFIDIFMYATNARITKYDIHPMEEVVNDLQKDVATIIVDNSPSCYFVYNVGKTNTGWAYQGANNTEYLWSISSAMENEKYGSVMLMILEQTCPDVMVHKRYLDTPEKRGKFLAIAENYGYKYLNESEEYIHLNNGLEEFVCVTNYKNIVVGSWGPNFALYMDESFNSIYINDSVYETLTLLEKSGQKYDTIYIFGDDTLFDCEELLYTLRDRGCNIVIDTSSMNTFEISFKFMDIIFDVEGVRNYGFSYESTVIGNHDAENKYQAESRGITFLAQNPLMLLSEKGREVGELFPWYKEHLSGDSVGVKVIPNKWVENKTTFTVDWEGDCYLGICFNEKYLDWSVTDSEGKSYEVYDDAGIAAFRAVPGTYTASFKEKGKNLAKSQTYLFRTFYVGLVLMILTGLTVDLKKKDKE